MCKYQGSVRDNSSTFNLLNCPFCILMMKAKVGMKGIEIEWPVEGVGQQDVVDLRLPSEKERKKQNIFKVA